MRLGPESSGSLCWLPSNPMVTTRWLPAKKQPSWTPTSLGVNNWLNLGCRLNKSQYQGNDSCQRQFDVEHWRFCWFIEKPKLIVFQTRQHHVGICAFSRTKNPTSAELHNVNVHITWNPNIVRHLKCFYFNQHLTCVWRKSPAFFWCHFDVWCHKLFPVFMLS